MSDEPDRVKVTVRDSGARTVSVADILRSRAGREAILETAKLGLGSEASAMACHSGPPRIRGRFSSA